MLNHKIVRFVGEPNNPQEEKILDDLSREGWQVHSLIEQGYSTTILLTRPTDESKQGIKRVQTKGSESKDS